MRRCTLFPRLAPPAVAVICAGALSSVFGGEAGDAGPAIGADEAVAALVSFLERGDDEQPRTAEGDRGEHRRGPRDGKRRGPQPERRPGPRRPFDDEAPRGSAGPIQAAPPMPHGRPGDRPMVRAFAFQMGPDGVARGGPVGPQPGGPDGRQITVHVDGGQIRLDGVPPAGGDAHAQVKQLLDRILDKVNAIESRLGGPGPQGHQGPPPQPPHAGPAPQPHQHAGPQAHQPPPGQPGPGVPPHLQRHLADPPHGGMNPDEINRRFEEHARELHRRFEEMHHGLAEKMRGAAGHPEAAERLHRKLAEAHEGLQERFQDVRKRFAEQQERIERLEQEVRKLREELERRGHHGGDAERRKPVSLDGVQSF